MQAPTVCSIYSSLIFQGLTPSTEVSDPLMPDVRHPDTFATRTPESASKSYERIASRSKPGIYRFPSA
jgi:hypothetical protein